jgi:peptidoglycan/xylan/chitin deacetylase (PgdA/CDA1 family)
MAPYRLALSSGIGLMLAAFLLPHEWRAPAWIVVFSSFSVLFAWGVVSIRSPLFGRAFLAGTRTDAVALTFDDGPDPEGTPAVLDVLARRGVTATFFVVGERVRAHPELARRAVEAGHELGNHSARHSLVLNFLSRRGMRADLEACQEAIRAATGRAARTYRPPVGLRNPAVHPVCRALGLTVIGWQVRSLDKSRRAPEEVVRRVLARVRPGGIVMLHDGGQERERSSAILDGLLTGLEQRGLCVVALSALLAAPAAEIPATRAPRPVDRPARNR